MTIVRTFLLLAWSAAVWGQAAPDELQYSPQRMRMAVELRTRTEILHFIEAGWEIAVLVLLLRLGAARRMMRKGTDRSVHNRDISGYRRFSWRDRLVCPLSHLFVVAAILAVITLADLPPDLYRHGLALRYGLSIQGWGSWLWDWVKGNALAGAIAIPLLTGAIAIARRVRYWWIWAWAGTVAVAAFMTFLFPIAVDPLFHRFRPLAERHADLIPKLERVSGRAGLRIPPERMFEMEASEKSRTVNAYLAGFGSTKRIVLWDTTMATLTPEQIQTVFAHEAGHYVLNHVPKGLALGSAALLLLMWALSRVLGRDAGDPACLPKALLFFALAGFLSEPLVNAYSRWQEHQADVFELDTMAGLVEHEGRNSARVDLIMADINLEHPHPNPFIVWWLYDHPPSAERMRFALRYSATRGLTKF